MDKALREVGMDLRFTIYNLIAFTCDDGLLQFVPNSETITDIKKDYADIADYMRKKAENEKDFKERVLLNYIYSCAGYCTATYLLGIGDRHLENLMIDKDGKFFHIDFGFIFGKEPGGKDRWASKIRISKSMVVAMGGKDNNPFYELFEENVVKSFLELKKKKNYIMNLMYLMIHAGLGDL